MSCTVRKAGSIAVLPHSRALLLAKRGLLLQCPNCGGFTMVKGLLKIHDQCRICGLIFEHDDAFYLGASVVNYTFTALLALIPALVFVARGSWSIITAVVFASAVCLVFPVLFYWHSKSIWMALYYYSVPDDLVDAASTDLLSPEEIEAQTASLSPEEQQRLDIEEALAALEGGRPRRWLRPGDAHEPGPPKRG